MEIPPVQLSGNNVYIDEDIKTEEPIIQNEEFNGDLYVKKSGDTMTGYLKLTSSIYGDNSQQNTAFTNSIKSNIEDLDNQINHNSIIDTLNIRTLKFENNTEEQTKPFTNQNNIDIYTNKGNITLLQNKTQYISIDTIYNSTKISTPLNVLGSYINLPNSRLAVAYDKLYIQNNSEIIFDTVGDGYAPHVKINPSTGVINCIDININGESIKDKTNNITTDTENYILTNKTQSYKDAPINNTIVNNLNAFTYFDKNISFMRSDNVYRKYWIGLLGDNLNASTNELSFCCNGNFPETEVLMTLNNNGVLKLKGDLITNNLNINNSLLNLDSMIYKSNNKTYITSTDDIYINSASGKDVYINNTLYNNSADNSAMQIQVDNNTNQINLVYDNTKHITSSTTTTNIPHIYSSSLTADTLYINGGIQSRAFTEATNNQISTNRDNIVLCNQNINLLNERMYTLENQKHLYLIPYTAFEFLGLNPSPNTSIGSFDHSFLVDIGSKLYSQYLSQPYLSIAGTTLVTHPYFSETGEILGDFGIMNLISTFKYSSGANLNAYIYMIKISFVIVNSTGTIIYYSDEIGHKSTNTPSILYSEITYQNTQNIKYVSWWLGCKIQVRTRLYMQLPGFGNNLDLNVQVM